MDVGRKTHTLLEKCCDISTFGAFAGGWTNAFPHPPLASEMLIKYVGYLTFSASCIFIFLFVPQSLLSISLFCLQFTGNKWAVLPCPAGGPPWLAHVPVFAGIDEEPPAAAQSLPRQGRAWPRGGGRPGRAQVAKTARRQRLGEVKPWEGVMLKEDRDFPQKRPRLWLINLLSWSSAHSFLVVVIFVFGVYCHFPSDTGVQNEKMWL